MIRINLAQAAARRRARFQVRLPSPNLGLLFAVIYLGTAAGIGVFWHTLSREAGHLTADVDRASRELMALRARLGEGVKAREQVADLRKRLQAVEELTRDPWRQARLLDAFADTVPRDLWITALEERAALVRVSGSAFSPTAVADFMAKLRASRNFKEVDIVVSRQDLAKTPRIVTFEVTCRFES